ncbi:hypothetical protein EYR88_03525 [Arthrobacter sp. S41]|nr:hypothetical protein EYR88_03525 [Arthrobacter sp. S41]
MRGICTAAESPAGVAFFCSTADLSAGFTAGFAAGLAAGLASGFASGLATGFGAGIAVCFGAGFAVTPDLPAGFLAAGAAWFFFELILPSASRFSETLCVFGP